MTVAKAIQAWRWEWAYDRKKHGLGPTDDDAWQEYVNGLTMAEVLYELEIHGDDDE